jgi:hypothetical protein
MAKGFGTLLDGEESGTVNDITISITQGKGLRKATTGKEMQ